MPRWAFRLCEPSEAPMFGEWVAKNPQIDPADVQAPLKNPTTLFFCVTKDGVPVAFAPLYCTMTLAHLGFDPASRGADRQRALQVLLDGVTAVAAQYGVREITTLSKEEYPVAKWAMNHGFEIDERQLLKLDINTVLEKEAASCT